MSTPIRVVTGALVMQHGLDEPPRILLGQRGTRSDFAWHWECPGGKVEQGELPTVALRRELYEELHLAVQVGPLLFERTYGPEHGCAQPARVQLYVLLPTGDVLDRVKPDARALAGYGWFPLLVVPSLMTVPSLRDALPVLLERQVVPR